MSIQVSGALLRYAILAAELVEVHGFSVDVAVFPSDDLRVDGFSVDAAVFPAESMNMDGFSVDTAVFPTAATVITAQRIDMAVPLAAIDVSELRIDYIVEATSEARLAELALNYTYLPTDGAFALTDTSEPDFQIIAVCDPLDRASWIVFPDQTFTGIDNVFSVTSAYDTPMLGGVSVGDTNYGFMVPIQTGPLTTAAVDIDMVLTQSGSSNSARWAWKASGGTDYLAQNSNKWLHTFHTPATVLTPALDTTTISYNADSQILYWVRTDIANGYVRVYSRAASVGPTAWTALPAMSPHRMYSGIDAVKLVPMPDGGMLMYVWSGYDADSYYSSDNGVTWTPYSMRIIASTGTANTAVSDAQIDVGRSGQHIRMVYVESGNFGDPSTVPHTVHSSDWGLTWEVLEDLSLNALQYANLPAAPDQALFTLVPLNRADGGFMLAYLGTADEVRAVISRGSDPWGQAATLGLSTALETEAWTALTGYVIGDTIRLEGALSQTGGDQQPALDGNWCAFDIPISQPLTNSTTLNHTTVAATRHGGTSGGVPTILPVLATAVVAGEYVAYTYTRGDKTTGLPSDTQVCYSGGWTTHPMATDVLDRDTATTTLFNLEHLPAFGTMASGGWTPSGVASTQTNTYEQFAVTAGQTSERTKDFGATPVILVTNNTTIQSSSFGGTFTLGSGTTGDVGLGFVFYGIAVINGLSGSVELYTRLSSATTIQLYDATTATVLATLAVPDMTFGNVETHFKCMVTYNITTFSLEAKIMATQDYLTWVESAVVAVTHSAFTPGTSTYGTGQFIAAGSAQQLRVIHAWTAAVLGNMNIAATAGSTDIAGTPASSSFLPTIGGMNVVLSGVAGLAGDTYTLKQKSVYPPVNTLEDSPSIHWRSIAGGSAADQTVTYYAGDLRFFTHTAIALVGTVAKTATVEYSNDSAFATIVDTVNLDSTTYASIPVTAAVLSGLEITETGLNIARGELAGQIAVNTVTGAAGYIVRHPEEGTIHLEDSDGNAIDVSTWSGTISVHAPKMIAKFDKIRAAYVRVTFPIQPTPTGDQRMGTAVFGNSYTLNIPLEWTHTVTESANLTKYRTRSGVEFRHPEGTTQRAYSGRLVGDVVREREALGNLLRHGANFGERALYVVLNGERPHDYDAGLLCTWESMKLDNVANTADSLSKVRDYGDAAVELVEVV